MTPDAGTPPPVPLLEVERFRVNIPAGSVKGISERDAQGLARQFGGTVARQSVWLLTDGTEVLGPWQKVSGS